MRLEWTRAYDALRHVAPAAGATASTSSATYEEGEVFIASRPRRRRGAASG